MDRHRSFDQYWAARGKNLRLNMRKQRSKLLAQGVALTMQVLRAHADMAPAVARYGVMESAGWKAGKGTALDQKRTLFHLTVYRWPLLKKLAEARRRKAEEAAAPVAAHAGAGALPSAI